MEGPHLEGKSDISGHFKVLSDWIRGRRQVKNNGIPRLAACWVAAAHVDAGPSFFPRGEVGRKFEFKSIPRIKHLAQNSLTGHSHHTLWDTQ